MKNWRQRICLIHFDLLVDIVNFVTRRELAVLELVNKCFHTIINKHFVERPMLTFDSLTCEYKNGEYGFMELSLDVLRTEPLVVPSYLRIAKLYQTLDDSFPATDSGEHAFSNYLRLLEKLLPALLNCALGLEFSVGIDGGSFGETSFTFPNSRSILTQLGSKFLPLLGPKSPYTAIKFFITGCAENCDDYGHDLLAPLLILPRILRTKRLELEIEFSSPVNLSLPVDALLDWIYFKAPAEERNANKFTRRSLCICIEQALYKTSIVPQLQELKEKIITQFNCSDERHLFNLTIALDFCFQNTEQTQIVPRNVFNEFNNMRTQEKLTIEEIEEPFDGGVFVKFSVDRFLGKKHINRK